jgi:hypothetical protein
VIDFDEMDTVRLFSAIAMADSRNPRELADSLGNGVTMSENQKGSTSRVFFRFYVKRGRIQPVLAWVRTVVSCILDAEIGSDRQVAVFFEMKDDNGVRTVVTRNESGDWQALADWTNKSLSFTRLEDIFLGNNKAGG